MLSGFKFNFFNNDTFKEKIDMYDMIIANLLAGNSIIEPEGELDNSKIAIGFSNISSEYMVAKYFLITQLPDWLEAHLMHNIRADCINSGVKIDFYIYSTPYKIRWDSSEMKNRIHIWKDYVEKNSFKAGVFEYRDKRDDAINRDRIVFSTQYLNESELDFKRTTMKISILVKISGKRDSKSIINLADSIGKFKEFCGRQDIKYRELRVNLIDWLSRLGLFSLRKIKEVENRLSRRLVTDDVLASMNSYKQGRIGTDGVLLGIDVLSGAPVLHKFKKDPDMAENWLISAESGGGKSYFTKVLILYMLASGCNVTVVDYEGDEYYNLASYIRAGKSEDVEIISMGKGSTEYFDPMAIPFLTGNELVDDEMKENAIAYTLAMFRTMSCGGQGTMNKSEERIISTAIKRVYDSAGVTDNKDTWTRSKGLRIDMVYVELKMMIERSEYIDDNTDNVKHKALVGLVENLSTYFEEGEAKYYVFRNPVSLSRVLKARFIVLLFGEKGAVSSQTDPTLLALKQLSVTNVTTQITNYCKYIKKCYNVKVWEEVQKYENVSGSSEIVSNAITGGRKRGDINLIITNILGEILDSENELLNKIGQNIQCYVIGKIRDKDVRRKFCEKFGLKEMEIALDMIAKSSINNTSSTGRVNNGGYKHSFCIALDDGNKAIVKVVLPKVLRDSMIFRTGIM